MVTKGMPIMVAMLKDGTGNAKKGSYVERWNRECQKSSGGCFPTFSIVCMCQCAPYQNLGSSNLIDSLQRVTRYQILFPDWSR